MLKRDEEGAQLLLPNETSGTDGKENAEFKPQQFANSLGKLQAVSVKAPRKIIDVDVMIQDAEERTNNAQKDSRNYKQILLELERMYDLVIDVEDCEKKLMALPTNTAMRCQVEEEKEVAVARLGPALAVETRLRKYLVVRKGKALLIRALRLLNQSQTNVVCSALFSLFSLAVKKDREDKLLGMFWEAGIARHLAAAPIDMITSYLQILTSPSGVTAAGGGSKSPPPAGSSSTSASKLVLKVALATPLGVSVIATCLARLMKVGVSDANASKIVADIGSNLADVKDIAEPIANDVIDQDSSDVINNEFHLDLASSLIRKEHATSFKRFNDAIKCHH